MPKYYEINERDAKTAHDMMSFSDYREGSLTAEYRASVDKAYLLADNVVEVRPEYKEKAYGLADRYARKLADNFNKQSRIGMMCPSVMIAGPSNFPTAKKEKQNKADDRNRQEYMEIQKILDQIRNLRYGKEVIKSGDGDAVEKLEKKVQELKERQEHMKAVNAYYKKHGSLSGCPDCTEKEVDELTQKMVASWSTERRPFYSFELSNNNQNIHRYEGRLESLKAAKSKATTEVGGKYFKTVRNTETMRLQLFFDGKPEPEVRSALKENGFKWAPSQEAWQRQLTTNAEYALKRLVRELDELEGVEG